MIGTADFHGVICFLLVLDVRTADFPVGHLFFLFQGRTHMSSLPVDLQEKLMPHESGRVAAAYAHVLMAALCTPGMYWMFITPRANSKT